MLAEPDADFVVIPALDVLESRCVRLAQGKRSRVTVEGGDPSAATARFVREGATFLHLVDLDAAFGDPQSTRLLQEVVASAVGVPVQAAGGYRTLTSIRTALELGAHRVVIGTAALASPFLAEAAAQFGSQLAVAIDVRAGKVAIEGWTQSARLRPDELGRRCAAAGIARLIVTNTLHDGSLAGPDLALLDQVMKASGLPVLAAGGIASLGHLRAIRGLGCEGAIIGSALWTGRLPLADALTLTRRRA